jgi:hypothetical protein
MTTSEQRVWQCAVAELAAYRVARNSHTEYDMWREARTRLRDAIALRAWVLAQEAAGRWSA